MINKFRVLGAPTLVLIAGLGVTPAAFASADAECRQEAQEYGVDADQLEQYVYDCVASRGGFSVDEVAEEDATPAMELEVMDASREVNVEAVE